MKRWMKCGAIVLACALCAVLGAQFGMWLSFKTYGGPAEHFASRIVDEAMIAGLAAVDGVTAQSSQMRMLLPSVQSKTAMAAFVLQDGLNAPYPELLRSALRQLDDNPLVRADEGEWAAAAKAARTCILALPPEAADWSACVAPVKAAWPKPALEDPEAPMLARTP